MFQEVARIVTDVKAEHLRLNRRIEQGLAKINRYHSAMKPVTIKECIVGVLRDESKKEKTEGRFNVADIDQTKRKYKSCDLTYIKLSD